MNRVTVKHTVLGEGMPKICAPLVDTDYDSLINEAARFHTLPIDIAEWRADWFGPIKEPGILGRVLPVLNQTLGDIPLLFTFRTHSEGGRLLASPAFYRALVREAVSSGLADLADIELFTGDDTVRELIDLAHRHHVGVILSNHDFDATPDQEEILLRLSHMEALGADIAKIAVTPRSPEDVLTLLSATCKARAELSCPVITVSMKGTGLISRLSGEIFGSCLTFGSVEKASAPGQMDALELKAILTAIHDSL